MRITMPPVPNYSILKQTTRPSNSNSECTKQHIDMSHKNNNGQIKQDIVWRNVAKYATLHVFGFWALWRILSGQVMRQSLIFNFIYGYISLFGITAGVHRLWSHKTYKARLPLRIFLMMCQTASVQNDIYTWARDHRVHHKFTDTDADPHNAKRGFFFCHTGWLLVKKHPDVATKGNTIDMSDVGADPVVQFQRKYYGPMTFVMLFLLPTTVSTYVFGETLLNSILLCFLRYVYTLHVTWSVNSVAHLWGWKPYDRTINPVENRTVSLLAIGEGWHNYHHTFPWDYKAAELGKYSLNLTTGFLDLMALIGQAYDLKMVSDEMVRKRVTRTGDGSWKSGTISIDSGYINVHNFHDECVWGWDDQDMKDEDLKGATIKSKSV